MPRSCPTQRVHILSRRRCDMSMTTADWTITVDPKLKRSAGADSSMLWGGSVSGNGGGFAVSPPRAVKPISEKDWAALADQARRISRATLKY